MRFTIAIVVFIVGALVYAAPVKKGTGFKQEGYGSAGCGFGSMIFAGDPGKIQQIMAATTNGTSWNQAFGISSGTSNCQVDGTITRNMEIPAYIEVNKVALSNDAARGEGEALAGLANLMNCDPKVMGPLLKKNYNRIFVDTGMQPVLIEAYLQDVVTHSKACGV